MMQDNKRRDRTISCHIILSLRQGIADTATKLGAASHKVAQNKMDTSIRLASTYIFYFIAMETAGMA